MSFPIILNFSDSYSSDWDMVCEMVKKVEERFKSGKQGEVKAELNENMSDELNIAMNDSWQDKECIYLDWNVFKYMSSPRSDKESLDVDILSLVKRLKNKYIIPYSEGHIKDRSSRYKEEYRSEIEKDFAFTKTITEDYLLISSSRIYDEKRKKCFPEIIITKKSMMEYFDAYVDMVKVESTVDIKPDGIKFEEFTVDMNGIGEDHPLYEFLKNNDGKVSTSGIDEFVNDLYQIIFDDTELYKRLRSYIEKLDAEKILNQQMDFNARLQTDRLLYYMAPMIECLHDDENALSTKWKGICECWFSMNGGKPSFEQMMKQGYVLLDFHPLFNDKLKKGKNTLDNIVRDGSHCYYASRAKYFVSEDEKTRKKTALMYKTFGIKTKVVSEGEFVQIFALT